MWQTLSMKTRGRGDAGTRGQGRFLQQSAARPKGRVKRTLNPPSPSPSSMSPHLFVSVSPYLLLLILMAAASCSTREKIVYEPVNTKPIVGDDAMALRADWPRGVSRYQNGDVAAWSTRSPYETSSRIPEAENLLIEPTMYGVQTIALPANLLANPPGQPQVWYGVKWRPTYTAQPPLPPRNGQSASAANY